jgi:IS30 family transposase
MSSSRTPWAPRWLIRNQRPSAHLNQQPGHPGGSGGHSQLATKAQGDLSHTRPSRAIHTLTEGDLITGRVNKSAIGTLVDRASRYVKLIHLPSGRSSQELQEALPRAVLTLPTEARRTLTWDQGSEMACHDQIAHLFSDGVFFAYPGRPWERPSNENTNGLLRQYFPKRTDLSVHRAEDLEAVEQRLNNRPRKTLGWLTPAQVFAAGLPSP